MSAGSSKRAYRRGLSAVVACGLLSIFSLLPTSPSRGANTDGPVVAELSRYEGHWQRVEASESDAARRSAIESALKELSWLVRRMASGVLRKSTAPPPTLQFAWDGERLHQGMVDENGGFSRVIEADGQPRLLKDPRGEDFSATWNWTGNDLQLRWEQHQATGSNFYRLEEDAQTLIVEHTINVTAISNVQPIVFRSRFHRTELPARAAAGLHHVARMTSN